MEIPGIVLAPSLPTLAFSSSSPEPAWTFVAFGGWATIRSSLLAAMSSPSRLFHVARTYHLLVSLYSFHLSSSSLPLIPTAYNNTSRL